MSEQSNVKQKYIIQNPQNR